MNRRTLATILIISTSSAAYAGLGSKLSNNAAARSLQSGNVAAAEESINSALEGNAADPVILYNWATATLHSVNAQAAKAKQKELNADQKKKVQSAQIEFEKMLKPEAQLNGIDKKEIYYQNAISQELLGNTVEALKNYYQSLQEPNQRLDDTTLRKLTEKTQTNISRLLVDSKSKSSGQGGGGGGGGEGQDQSQGKDGESDPKNPNGKQGSGGQGNQKREPEFSGTDVGESQAQQILNSVSNQDRQVQQRKGQQQSKQNMQNGEEGDVSPRDNDKPW